MNKEHTLIRLVDDDESLLFSTKILLEALGWKVAAYNSPTEFLVRDNLSIPGCAVLDVRMPQMTGLEVQEMLIERGFAHFPLIFHRSYHPSSPLREHGADPEKKELLLQ